MYPQLLVKSWKSNQTMMLILSMFHVPLSCALILIHPESSLGVSCTKLGKVSHGGNRARLHWWTTKCSHLFSKLSLLGHANLETGKKPKQNMLLGLLTGHFNWLHRTSCAVWGTNSLWPQGKEQMLTTRTDRTLFITLTWYPTPSQQS